MRCCGWLSRDLVFVKLAFENELFTSLVVALHFQSGCREIVVSV